jgi:hypothetical protein
MLEARMAIDESPPLALTGFFPGPTATLSTEPFSQFLTEYRANVNAFFFIMKVVSRIDDNRVTAAKALLSGEKDELARKKLQDSIDSPDEALKSLNQHASVMSMNLTNGVVSAFQRYFSSIVQAAALKQPLLLSSTQIKVDDVLRFSRHRDLVSFIVDRKVNELAYGGINDLERFFNDRLGVKMFESPRERDLLRLFIEARNINVHNGGIVNDIFLSKAGSVEGFEYVRGKRFHVDYDALVALTVNAMKVAVHIDAAVSKKFRIRRKLDTNWDHG